MMPGSADGPTRCSRVGGAWHQRGHGRCRRHGILANESGASAFVADGIGGGRGMVRGDRRGRAALPFGLARSDSKEDKNTGNKPCADHDTLNGACSASRKRRG